MNSSGSVAGKVALVTGGSRGIGREITLLLAAEGANVSFIYQNRREAAEEVLREAGSLPGEVEAFQADVCDYPLIEKTVRLIIEKRGGIDILVNNAAVLRFGRIGFVNPREWSRVIDVDLKAVVYFCHLVSRTMMAQGSGRIINLSSVSAFRSYAGQAAYSASKAGVTALTGCLASELGRYGIRVIAVAPGTVDTDMVRDLMQTADRRRAIRPQSVARWVLFLCSEDAEMLQGQTLILDRATE